jgi:hypothetical protein
MCRFTFFCFLILGGAEGLCQKINEEYRAEAELLSKRFKGSVAAIYSSTIIRFEYAPYTGYLQVRETESRKLVATQPNASVTIRSYYHDQKTLESYSLDNENGRARIHDKFCGNVQQGDIFHSDAQVCIYGTTLAQMGHGIQYESVKLVTDPKYYTQAFFVDQFPAKKRQIKFVIPKTAEVDLVEMNFSGHTITKEVQEEKDLRVYTYTAEWLDLPPSVENLPGHLHFLPHIVILSKSYRYKNGQLVTLISNTDDLYKWYRSLTVQNKVDESVLRQTVNDLIAKAVTTEDKIKAIYYWVQDNIKYIAFEDGLAGFKPEDAHQVFYKRYGDCKGMANLTKAMLTIAGIDARLTWVGTTRIPYSYDLPTLAVDNHMICTAYDNQRKYILDATMKYGLLGEVGQHIQGKEILIENADKYTIDSIAFIVPRQPLEEVTWKYQLRDSQLEGQAHVRLRGDLRSGFVAVANTLKNNDRISFMKGLVVGPSRLAEVDLEHAPVLSRDSVISLVYKGHFRNQSYQTEKELYVDLDVDEPHKNDKIPKDRMAPYRFAVRNNSTLTGEFVIPKGYTLGSFPKDFTVSHPYFEFSLAYRAVGDKIIYTRGIQLKKEQMPVAVFSEWNQAIDGLRKFYNEQIVLKKIHE